VSAGGGIGILGGTFNPIHLGHLRAAEEVREEQGLDEMWFVPAALPPHKQPAVLVSAAHRLRMVELAVRGVPGFRVSSIELERSGPSYTIDTLTAIRAQVGVGTRLVFVLGSDAFAELHTWKRYAEIFGACDLVVVARPPAPARLAIGQIPLAARGAFWYDSASGSFRHESGHVLRLQQITGLDISAESIRTRLAARRSIRFLVPSDVESYIAEYGLYGAEVSPR
jgi:nicotinate-nucleotide adenylyltransferase